MKKAYEDVEAERTYRNADRDVVVEVPPNLKDTAPKKPHKQPEDFRLEEVIKTPEFVNSKSAETKETPKTSKKTEKFEEAKAKPAEPISKPRFEEEEKVHNTHKPTYAPPRDTFKAETAQTASIDFDTQSSKEEEYEHKDRDAAEEEFMEEIEKKERKLDYADTPFYMRQDRPVFSGKESKIPTSTSARAFHFGALGVSIVGGTISEAFKQTLGISQPLPESVGGSTLKRYAMTDSNSTKLANTLCKMRGAALKIGQILSNTEDTFIPKSIQKAFDRARQRADIMPKYQVTEVLERELGSDWKSKFSEFSLYPLAAASIGQVHEGRARDGRKVAVKVQYPNIGESIDSDFKNFKRLLRVLGVVPSSLYLDELMHNVNQELHEECDYSIEANKQKTYKVLLGAPEYRHDYHVPDVYDEMSTKHILTQEFINGVPIDELVNESQEVRDRAGTLLLKLCLHELFLFKFMQTDPNPANFYYDTEAKRLNLIDMGAARYYHPNFVDDYFQIVYGAATEDKEKIVEYSKRLGFLTGEENRQMLESHAKSALYIGEPFKHEGPFFDFGDADISRKLMKEIPVMLKNRLSPPPQEVYSLHRKLSGSYFLCIKMRSRVNSRELFREVSEKFARENNKNL